MELDYNCCRGPDPVGDKSGRGFSRRALLGCRRESILLQGLLESLQLSAIGGLRQAQSGSAEEAERGFGGQGTAQEAASGG